MSSNNRYYIYDISGNVAVRAPPDVDALKRQLEYRGTKEAIEVSKKAIERIAEGKKPIDGREVFDILSRGNAEFQEKMGRPMTYSEMRELYG